MEERKRRDFYVVGEEVPILICFAEGGNNALALVQPSLRRTHSYRNLPYKTHTHTHTHIYTYISEASGTGLFWVSPPSV
jgi:hypothetical protein